MRPRGEVNRPVNAHASGFTLLEVIIVLVIAGLIIALGLPKIHGAFSKTNVRNARVAFGAIASRARATAVQRGCTATLRLTTGSSGQVWITACKVTGSGTDTVGSIEPLGTRYGTSISSALASLQFDPRGMSIGNTAMTVTFTASSGDKDSAMINSVGKVVR